MDRSPVSKKSSKAEEEKKQKDEEDKAMKLYSEKDVTATQAISKNAIEALKISLQEPPVKGSIDTKDKTLLLIMRILSKLSLKQLDEFNSQLDDDALITLLGYTYKAWEKLGNKKETKLDIGVKTTVLFKIHSKIIEKLGIGAISTILSSKIKF